LSYVNKVLACPGRILIVDDDQDNRELLQIILKWDGFITLTANGGAQALTIAAAEQPDLILLDLMMPDLDGYEVTALLKSGIATQHIPVVIISAMNDSATQLRLLSAGVQDFICKPIDRLDLCRRVKHIIARKPGAPPRDYDAA
jgi:two-component system cell cycle response regulator